MSWSSKITHDGRVPIYYWIYAKKKKKKSNGLPNPYKSVYASPTVKFAVPCSNNVD